MNPRLELLQPYPFEKLRALYAKAGSACELPEIKLSIGEPQHATPAFIKQALTEGLSGLANYPATQGLAELRQAIATWIAQRYGVPLPEAESQVLPINGSREALFAFAQAVIDPTRPEPLVVCPNPFYQIYEGAALLAGASPVFIDTVAANQFEMDFSSLSGAQWSRVQLIYVCSPGNPTGKVIGLDAWKTLFELSDRYGLVIASDECYSEIFFAEEQPPLGSLQAARALGRDDYRNLVMFSSLSKRSNVPGMRSGFVAGDASLLKKFLLYRTYHGSAMNPAVQTASLAAWRDEEHVRANRRLYHDKFTELTPTFARCLTTGMPEAGFYFWASVAKYAPMTDTEFAARLKREYNVSVLPGSYLGRAHAGRANPGNGYVRIALVADIEECRAAAERLGEFCQKL